MKLRCDKIDKSNVLFWQYDFAIIDFICADEKENIMDIFSVFTMVGGLALFLYGMNVMGDGLAKVSGGKL